MVAVENEHFSPMAVEWQASGQRGYECVFRCQYLVCHFINRRVEARVQIIKRNGESG